MRMNDFSESKRKRATHLVWGETEQSFSVSESMKTYQFSLANTRWAAEKQRCDRFILACETRSAEADRICNGFAGVCPRTLATHLQGDEGLHTWLANNFRAKKMFHLQQLLLFCCLKASGGDASPSGDDFCNRIWRNCVEVHASRSVIMTFLCF